jgi:hypothetical protein
VSVDPVSAVPLSPASVVVSPVQPVAVSIAANANAVSRAHEE